MTTTDQQVDLSSILLYAVKLGASDVHLGEGDYIGFRVHGEISKFTQGGESAKLVPETFRDITLALFQGDEARIKTFHDRGDVDFAYIASDGTSFRVNGFRKLGRIAYVMRRIEREPKSMDSLGLPKGVSRILPAKQGLFLVTGPTGSGKSTTLVSILDRINETRKEHIITIEDPIEFIFSDKQSIFSQREVGRDTDSFVTAIRGAMREDPDVVMVGEMRDRETVEAALNLAETGHLVFSTLHTAGSVQTINRLVQFFDPDIQSQVRMRIADSLLGVLSQRLIPRADHPGRIAIHELMFITHAIKNLIKTNELVQILNNIQLGSSDGMITMRDSADRLRDAGLVREEDYIGFFTNE